MKKCSTPLVIREIKTKTHNEIPAFTPRMVTMANNTKCWSSGATNVFAQLVGIWKDTTLWKALRRFLVTVLPRQPSHPSHKHLPKRNQSTRVHRHMNTDVCNSFIPKSPPWKRSKCPSTDERVNTLWCSHSKAATEHEKGTNYWSMHEGWISKPSERQYGTLICSDAKPVYGCSWLGRGAQGSFAVMGLLRLDGVMVLWVYTFVQTHQTVQLKGYVLLNLTTHQ